MRQAQANEGLWVGKAMVVLTFKLPMDAKKAGEI